LHAELLPSLCGASRKAALLRFLYAYAGAAVSHKYTILCSTENMIQRRKWWKFFFEEIRFRTHGGSRGSSETVSVLAWQEEIRGMEVKLQGLSLSYRILTNLYFKVSFFFWLLIPLIAGKKSFLACYNHTRG